MSDTRWPAVPTARSLIRDEVVAILKRGLPGMQERIFRARTWPLQDKEAPALMVYGWEEQKDAAPVSSVTTSYGVSLMMAVQILVSAAGRHAERVEQDLEELAGVVCELVMSSQALLGYGGRIERIAGVKTTLGIKPQTGERSNGEGLIIFDMRFSESYTLPPPEVECEEAALVLQPITVAAP